MAVKDCRPNRSKRLRLSYVNITSSRNQESVYETSDTNDTRLNESIIIFRNQNTNQNNQSTDEPDKTVDLFDSFRNTNHLKELHCR